MSNHTLHDTGYNLFLIAVVLVKENLALFLADLLKDNVLRILCGDTAEFVRMDRNLNNVADLSIGVLLLCFHQGNLFCRIVYKLHNGTVCKYAEITGLSVDGYVYIVSFSKMILVCLDQGLLNGIQQSFLADVFVAFQFIQSTH